jgi:hypothetical protein
MKKIVLAALVAAAFAPSFAMAEAGDIVIISGIEEIGIGVTIADKDNPVGLEMLSVDEPTLIRMVGEALAEKALAYVKANNVIERLSAWMDVEALRAIADQHKLCYGPLGLEKLPPGKACFRAAIRQCAGVCRGDESPEAHRERLFSSLLALRVECWPYPGAVGLIERDGEFTQIHVVQHWCYLGSAPSAEAARQLSQTASQVAPHFDADGYKILCRPVLTGSVEIVLL